MTRDALLSELLKAKANKGLSADEIIDEFIRVNSKLARRELEAGLANLLIFISQNLNMQEETLRELIESKISSMGLNINPLNLEETYKKLSLQTASIGISFDKIDIKATQAMKNNFYWMRREFNDKFQTRLKEITQKVFSGEIARKDIAAALRDEFKKELDMDISYFEGVSDHIISQSQNIARVNQARKYGAKHYKVIAIMDARTSDICRSMNGRIIPAEHLERQVDNITASKSMADKKAAATWAKEPYLGRSDKMSSNFGLPPYHFRCRTEVVPVWIDEYEHEGVKMRATEAPSKDEIVRHIDKTGVERTLSLANANDKRHSQNLIKRTPSAKMIAALNSITQISPHKNTGNKSIAKTQNGYILVFDGDKIDTIFPTESKKIQNTYFEKYAKKDKIEIIKRWWQA